MSKIILFNDPRLRATQGLRSMDIQGLVWTYEDRYRRAHLDHTKLAYEVVWGLFRDKTVLQTVERLEALIGGLEESLAFTPAEKKAVKRIYENAIETVCTYGMLNGHRSRV